MARRSYSKGWMCNVTKDFMWNGVRRCRRSSQSQAVVIWRTVWPRITKVYAKLHTDRVYNPHRTGHDVTTYFWSAVIDVRKTAENYAFNVFNLESPKIWQIHPYHVLNSYTRYDVTGCFQLQVIEVQKTVVEIATSNSFVWKGLSHDHEILQGYLIQ